MYEVARDLLGPGNALLVAVADADGVPFATRGWGVVAVPDRPDRLRLFVDADDVERFTGTIPASMVALTGADPETLRSVQVKGRILAVEPSGPGDVAASSAHRRATWGAISRADGTPVDVLERLTPRRIEAWTITVEDCFDQTPGPEAGSTVEDP